MKITKKGILKNPITSKELIDNITKTVTELSIDCVNHAKDIVIVHSDTGEFVNSIWSEVSVTKNKIGFTMYDGVSYGIYHEKGTKLHWVPFYRNGNISQPILADWGRRVLKLSQEEMIEMGGIKVKLDKLEPFLKSILFIQGIDDESFEIAQKEFENQLKRR